MKAVYDDRHGLREKERDKEYERKRRKEYEEKLLAEMKRREKSQRER